MFLLETFDDPAQLAELATAAEDVNVPVVVDVSGAPWAKACVETALKGDEVQAALEAWTALRTAEESRWLSATVNRVVLANDGTGAGRRTVLGSPAAALAAMLASSYRYTAGFGRVFGNDGALRGGGLLEIASGPQRGTMVPVETFIPLRAQNDLAKLGLLAMGSGRNSDKVILSAAPTARQSADAVPLPAQVLTGRVVRFAQWVRDQIPPGTTDADVKTMFKQAAEFFLLVRHAGRGAARRVDPGQGRFTVRAGGGQRARAAGGDAVRDGVRPAPAASVATCRATSTPSRRGPTAPMRERHVELPVDILAPSPVARAPVRTVVHGDAIAWLHDQGPLQGASVITSLPDVAEVPALDLDGWRSWFEDAATEVMCAVPDDGVAIFFQSDIKRAGLWIDKGAMVARAAESTGMGLLFHKIVCRHPAGTVTFGRASYSHLLGFARRLRPALSRATADVIPDAGFMPGKKSMGVAACADACRFVLRETSTRTVVDPFCGFGTVLAVANALGMDAVGVDLSTRMCRRARTLRVEL